MSLELAQSLSALTEKEVEAIVSAANNFRSANATLSALTGKQRKKRGPNKPKAEPPKRRGRPPAVPKSAAFSSALDKLKAVKEGGIKIRRPSASTDEGGDES